MDNINSQIGQNFAREQASVLNEKTFQSNNLVGMQTGASQFTRSDNVMVSQQVRNLDKTVSKLPEQAQDEAEKKLKQSSLNADNKAREDFTDLSAALEDAGDFLKTKGTALSFSIDEATDKQVVTVTDAASGDVIRQIPSEEVLNFAERMREIESTVGNQVGVLIDKQV